MIFLAGIADNGQYLVVVIKKIESGNYFSTMYSTGFVA